MQQRLTLQHVHHASFPLCTHIISRISRYVLGKIIGYVLIPIHRYQTLRVPLVKMEACGQDVDSQMASSWDGD
jgi:hypothetical protein